MLLGAFLARACFWWARKFKEETTLSFSSHRLCQPTTTYNARVRPCSTAVECYSCNLVGLFEGGTQKVLKSTFYDLMYAGKHWLQELVWEMKALDHGLLISIGPSKYQCWKHLQMTFSNFSETIHCIPRSFYLFKILVSSSYPKQVAIEIISSSTDTA